MKTITLKKSLDAIENDPTPKVQRKYTDKGQEPVNGLYPSCAIGGASQALGIGTDVIEGAIRQIRIPRESFPRGFKTRGTLDNLIVAMNDSRRMPKAEIAKRVRAMVESVNPKLLVKRLSI